ncbi:MAG TPA: alpha/beta fold hydrolase [Trebonia sp.]|jgi:alpha/beta superfamily hydrolase|nr:alpha/beta fold hydrolase [Trebonia sp.]
MTHAVLLPPYFALGGGQRNRVISALYDRLLDTPVVPHRFDFSSVSQAAAEADTVAQIEACEGPVLLIGYSFGAAVAAAITHPAVAGWALIAPALAVPQFVSPASPLRPPAQPAVATDPRPKLVVVAPRDAWFGPDVLDPLVADWVACDRQTVPSADHFFAATTDDVAARAAAWAVTQAAAVPSVR